ncbi:hypothetical protein [Capillimicrobium parvum]|uniref:Uncharacterized protein n=1 Tax=Capillimicrobium parvum TaxID=2884022 RepID=A0A9E6XXM0_9ACTN|nr:hypothetical protein [Capillimicrobium parvum]UGS35676.1 hypothetical protein DSM104329_02071 [Capillimicrobium parvum]
MRLLVAFLRWTYVVCGAGAIAIGIVLAGESVAAAIALITFGLLNIFLGVSGRGVFVGR